MTGTELSNPFDYRGPSTLDLGRVRSAAQLKKDANRVNQYSDFGRSTNSDKTKAIVGKPNEARSQ